MDTKKIICCMSRCIEFQYALLHAESLVRSEAETIINIVANHLIDNIDTISCTDLQYAKDCCETLSNIELPLTVQDMLNISQVISNLKTRLDINV